MLVELQVFWEGVGGFEGEVGAQGLRVLVVIVGVGWEGEGTGKGKGKGTGFELDVVVLEVGCYCG